MDYCCEFDQGVAAEDSVVGVVYVDHIEGYRFGFLYCTFAECDIELYLSQSFDSLASEANEWILRLLQRCFCETHFDEALLDEDICRAPIVNQDSPYIISCEVH
jgi:hypothetical protein